MEPYTETQKKPGKTFIISYLLVFLVAFSLGFLLRHALTDQEGEQAPAQVASPTEEDAERLRVTQAMPEPPEEPRLPVPLEEDRAVLPAPDAEQPEPVVPQETGPALKETPPAEEPAKPEEQTEAGEEPAVLEGFDVFDEVDEVWPARHLFISVRGASLDADTRAFLEELKPGAVVLLGNNIRDRGQTIKLVRAIKEAVGLGDGIADLPLIAVDQEGGAVNRLRLKDAPSARELGRVADVATAREVGHRYATECESREIGVLFAPVLDVYEPGAEKSMETRSFGQDGALVAALGLAFADGVMEGGVIPVVKHYPGHGAARQDSHDTPAVLIKGVPELAQVMYPFAEAVARKIPGVMVGHITVPAVDTEHPNRPASISPVLIQQVLRERWGYDGVVLTDDMAMRAMTKHYATEQAAVEALQAGCDAVMFIGPDPDQVRAVCQAIEAAVEEGALSRDRLGESRKRLESWQAWLRKPTPLKGPLPQVPSRPIASPVEESAELPAAPPRSTVEVRHRIRQGETLWRLAADYGVTRDDIIDWNDLDNTQIRFGDTLVLYVPPETAERMAAPEAAPLEPAPQPPNTKKLVHAVRRGEILSRIAARYGVRQNDILAWNALDDPNIKYGKKLVIYVPAEE